VVARDKFHQAVKNALLKDQWQITHDPLSIQIGNTELFVDLGADRIIAAEKEQEKIAVEIKSFVSPSLIYEFHAAMGQFLNYRLALQEKQSDRMLFLAVPNDVNDTFFSTRLVQLAVKTYQLKLLIYEAEMEEIIKWIK
jgi:hypothetical protein